MGKHRHLLFTIKITCLCNQIRLRAVLKLSRDVIDFEDNGNLFHSNGAAYLSVRDRYDFSLTESTTKII